MKEYFTAAKNKIHLFLTWQWVKRFLYWLVVSAGTVSECVFLVASIWVSLNATVHPLMLQLMSQGATVTLSQMAISAFTSLPEIILGLAVVTTYGHIKFFAIHRKASSLVWAILFGLPTIVFAGLTTWTLAASALQIGYTMPSFLIAIRVLAGYAYGFLSMLFVLIGEPDNADYVGKLKGDIDRLNQEIDSLKTAFASELNQIRQEAKVTLEEKQTQIEQFQNLIKTQNEQVLKLAERASSLELRDLENYPKVVSELVEKQVKTVSVDAIVALTGHSKRRINAAKLQKHSRNKSLIMVSSLIEWLKTVPLPETPTPFESLVNEHSNGHREGDTDPLELLAIVTE